MSTVALMRVSSDEQRKRETIAMQREQIERYALKNDIAITDWYADDGVSGTIPIDQRPEGRRLIADARAGRIERLLIYKLDRLGRDALVTLSAIDALDQCGVEIVSITQNFDLTTPHGKFQAVIDCGVSGYERDTLVERSIDGNHRIARAGGWLGGKPPFGYRLSGVGSAARLVPSDVVIPHVGLSEAEVVREMYRRVVEDRQSCQKIADWLNSLAVPTVNQREGMAERGHWSLARVRNVLINSTYRGVQVYGKTSRAGGATDPIEREVPALVTPETWQRARQQLASNRKLSQRNTKQEYLLRGLITCGTCGRTYNGHWQHQRSGSYLYYFCPGRRDRRGEGLKCPPVNGRALEQYIWDKLAEWSVDPQSYIDQAWGLINAERENLAILNIEIGKAQRALRGLASERDAILVLYRKGRISEADLDRQFDKIDAEGHEAEAQIAALRARANAAGDAEARLIAFNATMDDLKRYIAKAHTSEERRELVARCIDRIEVHPVGAEQTVSIAFSFDRLNPEIVTLALARGCDNPLMPAVVMPWRAA